ncbi:DUF5667 domain-containing protein [Chloroflexota bacterium]
MNKENEFNNILDECLERVLFNGETVEQCLAAYSEYSAELEPLLQTALDTRDATAIKPRPEFRERAGNQFQAALREMELKKNRSFFNWQPKWATGVVAVIILLMVGSGTVVGADNSLPGESLYQVKLLTETVRLALTPSSLGKAELYVNLADMRVNEIIRLVDEGKADQLEQTSDRLNGHLVAMTNLDILGGEGLAEKAATTFEAPQAAVREMPLAPAPAPAPAPKIAPAPLEKAPVMTAPGAPELAESVVPGGVEKADGKGTEPDELATLRVVLSSRAVENAEVLWVLLERAPESAKPALERAIIQASVAYEQALSHLD